MTLHVKLENLAEVKRSVQLLPAKIQTAVTQQFRAEADHVATDAIIGAATGDYASRHVAGHIRVRKIAFGGQITATAGDKPFLLYGAEFGGRKARKTYASRRGTNIYVIYRRRTTMQFRPHLGRKGYFFWPAVRRETRGIIRRTVNTVERAGSH